MNVLLEAGHFADNILNNLRRELLQNLILGSSQDKRGYSLFKAF
jgi:hypothetical protein